MNVTYTGTGACVCNPAYAAPCATWMAWVNGVLVASGPIANCCNCSTTGTCCTDDCFTLTLSGLTDDCECYNNVTIALQSTGNGTWAGTYSPACGGSSSGGGHLFMNDYENSEWGKVKLESIQVDPWFI
jgi:hypothetical protein